MDIERCQLVGVAWLAVAVRKRSDINGGCMFFLCDLCHMHVRQINIIVEVYLHLTVS